MSSQGPEFPVLLDVPQPDAESFRTGGRQGAVVRRESDERPGEQTRGKIYAEDCDLFQFGKSQY
jgi:hypothetical protein